VRILKRLIGPKGQIVIPKKIREALGLKPGGEVLVELREGEAIIRKPRPTGYVEYYIQTRAKKLKTEIDLKDVIEREVAERLGLSRR
jgi:AbrB family looped-hinge helix DNA binding protein